jgi:D-alanyl-D-alanine endopeptidase (penicillin-binding protein 7)
MRPKTFLLTLIFLLLPVFLGVSPQADTSPSSVQWRSSSIRIPPQRPAPSPWPALSWGKLRLRSNYALVMDQLSHEPLYAKNAEAVTPIASITKLMTAMVVLDARLPLNEPIKVTQDDVDTLRRSASRLPVGWTLSRGDLLHLALMASENRAASALARTYPGGTRAFVDAMNQKARSMGLAHTSFQDSTGLHSGNVSTALDLAKLVCTAYGYPTIKEMTTSPKYEVRSRASGRMRVFGNSNRLIHNNRWDIGLSKTGYITDAGFCLVMQADILGRPVVMVLLDSAEKYSRIGDAMRIKNWMQECSKAGLSGHRAHRNAD